MTSRVKLGIAGGVVGFIAFMLWRRSKTVTCQNADSIVRDGKCWRTGTVEPLFNQVDASDAVVGFDDNGSPLITRPSQL